MYDYKVVPAPRTGLSQKGLKKTEDKFAYRLETVMNELAVEGWEYVRAETLPAEERVGLTSKTTKFHNVLVFRRPVAVEFPETAPEETSVEEEGANVATDDTHKAPPAAAPTEPARTPPAKAARELATKQTPEQTAQRPRGEMIGILRTIKGDKVPSRSSESGSLAAGHD